MTMPRSFSRMRCTHSIAFFCLARRFDREVVVVLVLEVARLGRPQTGHGGCDRRRLEPDGRHGLEIHDMRHDVPRRHIRRRPIYSRSRRIDVVAQRVRHVRRRRWRRVDLPQFDTPPSSRTPDWPRRLPRTPSAATRYRRWIFEQAAGLLARPRCYRTQRRVCGVSRQSHRGCSRRGSRFRSPRSFRLPTTSSLAHVPAVGVQRGAAVGRFSKALERATDVARLACRALDSHVADRRGLAVRERQRVLHLHPLHRSDSRVHSASPSGTRSWLRSSGSGFDRGSSIDPRSAASGCSRSRRATWRPTRSSAQPSSPGRTPASTRRRPSSCRSRR